MDFENFIQVELRYKNKAASKPARGNRKRSELLFSSF